MATYCISDIHGQLDAFKIILQMIRFRFTGEDTIYIIGDMVDWGDKSIETILECMSLDKQYENVHVLMGNHELMMLNVLGRIGSNEINIQDKENWFMNKGSETMEQFETLSLDEQKQLINWMKTLPYYIEDIEVNNRHFYLSHADVYKKGSRYSLEDTVWNRIDAKACPFSSKEDEGKILVYGHTITSSYKSFNEKKECKIFNDINNRKIDIDCGAKVIGIRDYARLACLRLDDFAEFYVDVEDIDNTTWGCT